MDGERQVWNILGWQVPVDHRCPQRQREGLESRQVHQWEPCVRFPPSAQEDERPNPPEAAEADPQIQPPFAKVCAERTIVEHCVLKAQSLKQKEGFSFQETEAVATRLQTYILCEKGEWHDQER